MHSFYVLELWVAPGGARKAHYYLFNNIEEAKQALVDDLSPQGIGPHLALCYGETINLLAYVSGEQVWKKDLHPFIIFHLPDYPPLQGTADGRILASELFLPIKAFSPGLLSSEDIAQERLRDKLTEFFEQDWDRQWSGQQSAILVEIHWEAIDIPVLEGQLLQPGEVATVLQSYSQVNAQFTYGYNAWEG